MVKIVMKRSYKLNLHLFVTEFFNNTEIKKKITLYKFCNTI